MATRIENAQIKSTMLGMEDHGIFTAYVHVTGPGWGCGFGGYAMDSYDQAAKERVGTAFGMQFIVDLLATLRVETWEQLKGTYVRVETEGLGGGVTRIGHLLEDRWFDPKELVERFKKAGE